MKKTIAAAFLLAGSAFVRAERESNTRWECGIAARRANRVRPSPSTTRFLKPDTRSIPIPHGIQALRRSELAARREKLADKLKAKAQALSASGGVQVKETRNTVVIPAGSVGNYRDINMVSEKNGTRPI